MAFEGGLDAAESEEPICRIGIIADIQYADREDVGVGFWGRNRYYSDGVRKAMVAAEAWNAAGCCAAINLGDTIDRSSTKPVEDLTSILDAFAAFKGGPLCHTFGNHEVSAISRAELLPMMGIPPPETTAACGGNGSIANSAGAAAAAASAGAGAAPDSEEPPAPSAVTLSASTSTRSHPLHEAGAGYFDLLLDGGVRLVALDTYDAAMAGYPEDHPKRARAEEMLIAGKAKKESPYLDHPELNGGVDDPQLAWLETVLDTCKTCGEVAIVFSHAPVLPEVTMDGYAVCWNNAAVRELLSKYKEVMCFICGHDHEGALRAQWVADEASATHVLYHLCLEAALEGGLEEGSHGVLEVYRDKLVVRGAGNVRDRYMSMWSAGLPIGECSCEGLCTGTCGKSNDA